MAVSDNFKAQIISRSDNFHAQIISRSDNFQDLLSTIDFFVGLFDLFSLKKKNKKIEIKKKKMKSKKISELRNFRTQKLGMSDNGSVR